MEAADQSDQHWVAPTGEVSAAGMAIKQHLQNRSVMQQRGQNKRPGAAAAALLIAGPGLRAYLYSILRIS